MKGKIVIGEGEMDEAPMLYIDEIVGNKNSQEEFIDTYPELINIDDIKN